MGMEVIAFDPFISADRAQQMQVRLTTLEDLFRQADYIKLHIVGWAEFANDGRALGSEGVIWA